MMDCLDRQINKHFFNGKLIKQLSLGMNVIQEMIDCLKYNGIYYPYHLNDYNSKLNRSNNSGNTRKNSKPKPKRYICLMKNGIRLDRMLTPEIIQTVNSSNEDSPIELKKWDEFCGEKIYCNQRK